MSLATKKRTSSARVEELLLSEAQLTMPTTSKSILHPLINRIQRTRLGITMNIPSNNKGSQLSMSVPKLYLTKPEQDPVRCNTETHTPETAMKKVVDRHKDSHQDEKLLLRRNLSFQRQKLLRKLRPMVTERAAPEVVIHVPR